MVSKVFARAQNNPEFRALILNEARKEQGGDNIVFYAGIRNQKLGKGSVSDLFEETAAGLGYETGKGFFAEGLVSTLPRLSFSVYTGIEGTDISKFSYDKAVPVVAETRAFASEDKVNAVAFDGNL